MIEDSEQTHWAYIVAVSLDTDSAEPPERTGRT